MKYNYDHKYTMDFESDESLNSQLVSQGYILAKDGWKLDSYKNTVKQMFEDGIIRKQTYSELNSKIAYRLMNNIVRLEDAD